MRELEKEQEAATKFSLRGLSLKKVRGWVLFAIGWLLSPLCWWNDLIFNLPVAYGFGYVCSLFSSSWILPGTVIGYWLSNLIGILLMQAGAIDVFQSHERNLKKELFWGVVSSSIFTIVVVALIQLKVLDLPGIDTTLLLGGQ
ncbi:hypothetical protein H6F89_08650 [Cyanobacteria bacterium FACHB-63]|nr:hypothetical protein [Cyanobacteria bacterium FACHB-63]